MATSTVATAAGVAMLLYFSLSRRISPPDPPIDGPDLSKEIQVQRSGRRRTARRPDQAPATWREAVATLTETLRFTYSETLGKWPIGDLAFGIKYLMRRQGNLQIASEFTGYNCIQLEGPEIRSELIYHLRVLTLCRLFSKQPFRVFLESAGFSAEHVLIQEPKAGLLRPAFTIIRDERTKSFLLLIRGTHSIKDTLTAATGAVVPFHHLVLHEGGISNLVLGYAHCGMVAAARWIAKCTTPCLLKAINQHPDYNIKIIGHSLGGGTAALLTYILREHEEFSSTTCIAFAPAACMTWDLAESGKHFITAVINGADLVPSFSAAAFDRLRCEVTASSWLNDLRDQIQRTRFLNVVYRSASALGSHLPSISTARARVSSAGALLRPVSTSTQVVMKRAQTIAEAVVRTRSSFSSWSFSSWSCMGPRRRAIGTNAITEQQDNSDSLFIERVDSKTLLDNEETEEDEEEEEEELIQSDHVNSVPPVEDIIEDEQWFEAQVLKEAVENNKQITSDPTETHQFYPPGRIMHMVRVSSQDENGVGEVTHVRIYETPRDLYNKIRLSPTMINDHFMPVYKKMIELLIDRLAEEQMPL